MFVFNITLSVSFRVCDNISLGARAPPPAGTPSGVEGFWPEIVRAARSLRARAPALPAKCCRAPAALIYGVSFLFACAEPSAAVWPVAWLSAQPCLHWVVFNVPNRIGEVFCIANITIEIIRHPEVSLATEKLICFVRRKRLK